MNNTPNTPDKDSVELKRMVIHYLMQWKLILGTFVVAVILAILYLTLVPRTYEIMARILVQDTNQESQSVSLGEAAGLMQSFGLGSNVTSNINIDDEMSTLTSNAMLRRMILKLGINVNYYKPGAFRYKMYKETPLQLTCDSTTALALLDEIKFKVKIASDGSVTVTTKQKNGNSSFTFQSLPAIISLREGKFTLNYTRNKVAPYKMTIKMVPPSWVAEDLAKEFLVEEVSKSSSVIEITCQDYDRQRGRDMLNTLIDFYNQDAKLRDNKDAAASINFINSRLSVITAELANTETEIKNFKLKNNMTDIEYDVEFYTGQMQDLEKGIIELQSQSHVIDLMTDYVKDPKNKNSLVPAIISEGGQEKGSSPLNDYNEKMLERLSLLQSSHPNNPLIKQADDQLDKLRQTVVVSFANSQKGIQQSIDQLKGKEDVLLGKMGNVPNLERNYVEMKRQQEVYQGVYLLLLQKRESTMLTLGQQRDKAIALDNAFVKRKSIQPRKLYAAIGVMAFTVVVPIVLLLISGLFTSLKAEYKRCKEEEKTPME
jgi:tyrosine-protein kinase Etk/Wzc